MKIALLLTGQTRTFDTTKESILSNFDGHDLDLYTAEHVDIKHDFSILNRPNDIFSTSTRAKEHGAYWVNRLLAQWYNVKLVYDKLNTTKAYDIVFRCRYDVLFNAKIDLKCNDSLNVPMPHPVHTYNDHFAYGNQDIMSKYCSMYDAYLDMYKKNNIDISYAEETLKFYIEEVCNITTSFINCNYIIEK